MLILFYMNVYLLNLCVMESITEKNNMWVCVCGCLFVLLFIQNLKIVWSLFERREEYMMVVVVGSDIAKWHRMPFSYWKILLHQYVFEVFRL